MYPNSQWATGEPRSPLVESLRFDFSVDVHPPVWSVFGVVQCGLNAAVCLHVLVHLRGHEGPRVLIGEGLALAVGALGAQVRAVCHLILLHGWKTGERDTRHDTNTLIWYERERNHCGMWFWHPHHSNIYVTHTRRQTLTNKTLKGPKRGARIRSINMQSHFVEH